MPIERIPFGIPGLDTVLNGGLIAHHAYLLVGAAGTGKTLCSLQWLLDGQRRGDRTLFITLAEPYESIQRNVSSLNWDLSDLTFVDLNPVREQPGQATEYTVFPPSEVERLPLWQGVYDAIEEHDPDRVVIDSVTQLRYLSTDEYQFRKHVIGLAGFLHRHGCTAILTFEPSQLEQEMSVALAVDGIFRLRMQVSPHRVTGLRSVEVQKLRGSGFISGLHPLRIDEQGVRIFPHCIERPNDARPGDTQLNSGIEGLDRLIGGGIESGTTTIFTGPSGAGKSTLGTRFMAAAAREGMPSIIYAFEESPQSIRKRSEATGQSIEALIEDGSLLIRRVNPMELYPDEFLGMIREDVEQHGRRAVLIDSLRGYELAMEEFGSLEANLHNAVTYLNRKQVTTVIINEVDGITGPVSITDTSVSYLADSILLLRYAEYEGRVIKVVACLKKRHSDFDPALCELRITDRGIEVHEELRELRGILGGAPSTVHPAPSDS